MPGSVVPPSGTPIPSDQDTIPAGAGTTPGKRSSDRWDYFFLVSVIICAIGLLICLAGGVFYLTGWFPKFENWLGVSGIYAFLGSAIVILITVAIWASIPKFRRRKEARRITRLRESHDPAVTATARKPRRPRNWKKVARVVGICLIAIAIATGAALGVYHLITAKPTIPKRKAETQTSTSGEKEVKPSPTEGKSTDANANAKLPYQNPCLPDKGTGLDKAKSRADFHTINSANGCWTPVDIPNDWPPPMVEVFPLTTSGSPAKVWSENWKEATKDPKEISEPTILTLDPSVRRIWVMGEGQFLIHRIDATTVSPAVPERTASAPADNSGLPTIHHAVPGLPADLDQQFKDEIARSKGAMPQEGAESQVAQRRRPERPILAESMDFDVVPRFDRYRKCFGAGNVARDFGLDDRKYFTLIIPQNGCYAGPITVPDFWNNWGFEAEDPVKDRNGWISIWPENERFASRQFRLTGVESNNAGTYCFRSSSAPARFLIQGGGGGGDGTITVIFFRTQ